MNNKPRYKVGDILYYLEYHNGVPEEVLYKVSNVGHNSIGFYYYTLVILDDMTMPMCVGTDVEVEASSMDSFDNLELAFDSEIDVRDNLCKCDISSLINLGCRCGGK